MANRNLQSKVIKMRRRNRYARFSESKVMKTKDDGIVQFGKNCLPRIIDKASLSKQLIGIGLKGHDKRPSAAPMTRSQLNDTIRPKSEFKSKWDYIPKSLGLSIGREQAEQLGVMLKNQDNLALHHRIVDGRRRKVFCFYNSTLTNIFVVEIDYSLLTIRRSFNFAKIEHAQNAVMQNTVMWKNGVENISSE